MLVLLVGCQDGPRYDVIVVPTIEPTTTVVTTTTFPRIGPP